MIKSSSFRSSSGRVPVVVYSSTFGPQLRDEVLLDNFDVQLMNFAEVQESLDEDVDEQHLPDVLVVELSNSLNERLQDILDSVYRRKPFFTCIAVTTDVTMAMEALQTFADDCLILSDSDQCDQCVMLAHKLRYIAKINSLFGSPMHSRKQSKTEIEWFNEGNTTVSEDEEKAELLQQIHNLQSELVTVNNKLQRMAAKQDLKGVSGRSTPGTNSPRHFSMGGERRSFTAEGLPSIREMVLGLVGDTETEEEDENQDDDENETPGKKPRSLNSSMEGPYLSQQLVDARNVGIVASTISQTLESPLTQLLNLCTDVEKQTDQAAFSEKLKKAVHSLVIAMDSSAFLEPDLEEVLGGSDVDAETRSWLTAEYSHNDRRMSSRTSVSSAGEEPTSLHAWNVANHRRSSVLAESLKEFNFNVFRVHEDTMVAYLVEMFDDLGITENFHINEETLRTFCRMVRHNYNQNPYHNFRHAFDVAQTVYTIVSSTELITILTPLEVFGIFVSALCHDLDHPGLNNAFQTNAQTPLAILYNDHSVLENHHCAQLFNLVSSEQEANIFAGLSAEEYIALRKIIVECILETDPANHFETTTRFSAFVSTFNKEDPIERLFLCKVVLHCADISNPAKEWDVSQQWTLCLVEECAAQGKLEMEQGLPVQPLNQTYTNPAKNTVNFIDFVVYPIFDLMCSLLPEASVFLDNLHKNRERWNELVDDYETELNQRKQQDRKQQQKKKKKESSKSPKQPQNRKNQTASGNSSSGNTKTKTSNSQKGNEQGGTKTWRKSSVTSQGSVSSLLSGSSSTLSEDLGDVTIEVPSFTFTDESNENGK